MKTESAPIFHICETYLLIPFSISPTVFGLHFCFFWFLSCWQWSVGAFEHKYFGFLGVCRFFVPHTHRLGCAFLAGLLRLVVLLAKHTHILGEALDTPAYAQDTYMHSWKPARIFAKTSARNISRRLGVKSRSLLCHNWSVGMFAKLSAI